MDTERREIEEDKSLDTRNRRLYLQAKHRITANYQELRLIVYFFVILIAKQLVFSEINCRFLTLGLKLMTMVEGHEKGLYPA
jgi:hypothetical protein